MKLYHLLILFILSYFHQVASAQTGIGGVTGRIITSTSTPVTNASVSLENTKFTTKTDTRGMFSIDAVPQGNYVLIVSNVGFTAYKQNVLITPGKQAHLDLQLSESRAELSEVIIAAKRNGYNRRHSNTSTRIEMPLLETPQSVQSVSAEVMKDRQAFTLNEIAGTFTGMKANNGNGSFTMRGFTAYSPNDASFLLYNGIRGNLFLRSQQPLM